MTQTEAMVLQAERRTTLGTRASQVVRQTGRVPAVIYGHKQDPEAVTLDYHDLALELQHHHRLVQVSLDGKQSQYLVKEVQYDHLGDKVVHVDQTRVDLDERVTVEVEVELKGTPAGASDGGVLEQMAAAIELECVVTAIPESIRVLVNEMKVGDLLVAGDITLPAGARLVSDPEMPVAAVRTIAEEPEAEEAVEGEEGTEPEIIAREKAEGEEEES